MAVELGDAQFVSKLDDIAKQKAKTELNELNPKDRELAVQSFRQWILQQKWLKTPTDIDFLLRFLRTKKFSQLSARQTLENYWTIKAKVPEWFRDVDPANETIQEILRTGFYILPKQLDKHGRRVAIQRLGRIDLNDVKKKWGVEMLFKTIVMVAEFFNRDENVQVNGLCVLIDHTDVTMGHMMIFWAQESSKRLIEFYQDSLPTRMKGIHMYNEPTFFDAIYALISPFIKQKHKDRMHLHGRSLIKVYNEFGMAVLPNDYLPDDYDGPSPGPADQILEEMIKDMLMPDFRNYIVDISSGKYGVNKQERKSDKDLPHEASFRKLNID